MEELSLNSNQIYKTSEKPSLAPGTASSFPPETGDKPISKSRLQFQINITSNKVNYLP